MKMRVLVIDDEAKTAIRRVVEHAAQNPLCAAAVLRTIAGNRSPVGNDERFCCVVRDGYRCVFSLEEQPCGVCRHLSISVIPPQMLPNPAAVSALMKEFGFEGTLEEASAHHKDIYFGPVTWIERETNAINVVELK